MSFFLICNVLNLQYINGQLILRPMCIIKRLEFLMTDKTSRQCFPTWGSNVKTLNQEIRVKKRLLELISRCIGCVLVEHDSLTLHIEFLLFATHR